MGIPTPHIAAKTGDFAKTVLMPGDPLRAKFVAETYLENPVLVNPVRGINGYTGTYQGKKVSVMASGMGMPSIGIYSYELFNYYDVDNIIRIGTAGSMHPDLKIRDVAFAMGACTNSSFGSQFELPGTYAPMGVLCVEMEAAALYMNAARSGKNALAICTISDSIVTGEATTAQERQTSFNNMMKIALEIA